MGRFQEYSILFSYANPKILQLELLAKFCPQGAEMGLIQIITVAASRAMVLIYRVSLS